MDSHGEKRQHTELTEILDELTTVVASDAPECYENAQLEEDARDAGASEAQIARAYMLAGGLRAARAFKS